MAGGLDDTICAVATPAGEGGIGIVRVSGVQAVQIASNLVRLRSGQPLQSVKNRRLGLGDIVLPQANRSNHSPALSSQDLLLDEVMVAVMRGPRSFTAEDVVEIHCHGGAVILQRLCEACLALGARLAEPGEFTKRAFLNGRIDLAQAEGVLDTIRAKTAASLRMAQRQLRGGLSAEIGRIREKLIGMLAHVEASIDFVEEDISFIGQRELSQGLEYTIVELARLVASSREGRIWREGATVAIIGKPNVGKSSLMNKLLRMDRAIVTAIPGTTRDVLEDFINLGGVPVRLLDTAGIRNTIDPVELEGIKRSRAAHDEADLILLVLDGAESLEEEDRTLLQELGKTKSLVVLNKLDLPQESDVDAVVKVSSIDRNAVLHVSALTGEGIEGLTERVRSALVGTSVDPSDGVMVANVRHAHALARAKEGLERVLVAVSEKRPGEVISMELRIATDALGEVSGAVSTDDVLERIFSQFCIGK